MPEDLSFDASAPGFGTEGGVIVGNLFNGAASAAGLRPDDVITSLNGEAIKNAQNLGLRVADLTPGTRAYLTGRRGREPFKVALNVSERPTFQVQRRSAAD
jgi:S1-C subfamily serine protease